MLGHEPANEAPDRSKGGSSPGYFPVKVKETMVENDHEKVYDYER
jgi:hypothetical protein